MAQATFTPVPRPATPTAKAPTPTREVAGGWTVDRVLVVLAAGLLVAAILFEFGLDINVEQIVPGLPGLAFAVVLAFYARPWVYLTAGILVAVLPLMVLFLFGAIEGVTDPTTGRSYASLMCLVATVVFALGGGIHGFVATRKARGTPARDLLRSRSGVAAALLVAVLVGASFAGLAAGARVKEMASAGGGYDFGADTTVPVVMEDFAFVPEDVTVPVGQIVEIRVENKDSTFHTFTYEKDGVRYNHDVPGDSTVGFLVRFDEATTISYWCAPHSNDSPTPEPEGEEMRGTLVAQ